MYTSASERDLCRQLTRITDGGNLWSALPSEERMSIGFRHGGARKLDSVSNAYTTVHVDAFAHCQKNLICKYLSLTACSLAISGNKIFVSFKYPMFSTLIIYDFLKEIRMRFEAFFLILNREKVKENRFLRNKNLQTILIY